MRYKGRTIAVLSYWSITNPLSHATVLPQINALIQMGCLERVVLLTLERDRNVQRYRAEKLVHIPIFITPELYGTAGRIVDSVVIPIKLRIHLRRHKVHLLLAHGAPAGALAYKVWEQSKIPFYVSSFEPHADYMLESKVWSKFGLKYQFQKYWEGLQKKKAAGLLPVSEKYGEMLLREGMAAEKIFVVPCSVDAGVFGLNEHMRKSWRQHMNWQNATIGIYVGKYGGLYYAEEAFHIYKKCFEAIPHFRLIILSPQPQDEIMQYLEQNQIDKSKVHVASVPHQEVPQYLSAADLAFATIKSYPSARYCSPVKIGEYWANGLPVLLTEGVGDDSDVIKQEGGGATFSLQEEGSVERALQQIQQILKDPNHRQEISKLAEKYRSPARIREAYEYFFGQNREEQR